MELLESRGVRPRQARYQAALRPDMKCSMDSNHFLTLPPLRSVNVSPVELAKHGQPRAGSAFPAIRRADPVVYAVYRLPFGQPSSLLGAWAYLEWDVDLTHRSVDSAWLRRSFEAVGEQVGLQRK